MHTQFIVQTASAKMPGSCWGRYARVAVLEVAANVVRASMISPRAKGVVRVIETWERLNVGTTDRCASARALADAEALKNKLEARRISQRFGS